MHRRHSAILIPAVSITVFALLAAGCGGGDRSPGVANVTSTTTPAASAAPSGLGFARCMRSNGVAGFPDPDSSGEIPKPQVIVVAQANPNRFNAAQTACNHLLPNGSLAAPPTAEQTRTRLADWLSFARCMRGRGVTRFPDPTTQGQLTVEMVQAQGIDLHAPSVLRAVEACLPASHGLLTSAKVSEALSQASG